MTRLKGQVNSIDFVISIFVFTAVLVFIISFWFVEVRMAENTVHKERLSSTGIAVSDLMVKSPGVPEDWEYYNQSPDVLGLASYPNVLSKGKIMNFTNMSYDESRDLLGIDTQYYFYIEDMEGNRLHEAGNSSTGEMSITMIRFALLEGEKVRVWVVLHE